MKYLIIFVAAAITIAMAMPTPQDVLAIERLAPDWEMVK